MVAVIGVIGGSGLEKLFPKGIWSTYKTPYGDVEFLETIVEGVKVYFVPRHGKEHTKPPHRVNYKGNIWFFKSKNVKYVIATNAIGSIRKMLKPGMVVILGDVIDFTKRRNTTFFEYKPVHVDVTNIFCPELVKVLIEASENVLGYALSDVTIVVTEGPRFETPAEIRMFSILGADVVGMTTMPEAVLAKELNLCYAGLAMITNFAAGLQEKVSAEEVYDVAKKVSKKVYRVIVEAIKLLKKKRS